VLELIDCLLVLLLPLLLLLQRVRHLRRAAL
jgi:hypothetical protein